MLRRYRFELILILLIICAVVATVFSSLNYLSRVRILLLLPAFH